MDYAKIKALAEARTAELDNVEEQAREGELHVRQILDLIQQARNDATTVLGMIAEIERLRDERDALRGDVVDLVQEHLGRTEACRLHVALKGGE